MTEKKEFIVTAEMIDELAEWHQRHPKIRINQPLIPHLRQRFNLDNRQAIAVIREANSRRSRAL